jgi:PRC-barrel domain
MAKATAHPDRRLISSEDVQGTDVYGVGDESMGEIDHLLIDKVSGRVVYAVMSFGGFLDLGHSHYPIPWADSNTTPISVVTGRALLKSSCEMRRSSVTTHGKTATGRPGRISTTAFLPIGALECPAVWSYSAWEKLDEPAAINLLSVFERMWRKS